jgi:GAF domain-containing protein
MQRLVSIIPTVFAEVDGVTLTMRRGDWFITSAASDDCANDLDRIQYGVGEGPCLDAASIGRQMHAEALVDEDRWPSFTPEARDRGIESILSSPLLANDHHIGALNLYSRSARAFPEQDQRLAMLLAAHAAVAVAPIDSNPIGGELENRIEDALASRETISQAQGALMERHNIGADRAHAVLRQRSIESANPMREEAADVLAHPQSASPPSSLPDTGGRR